MKPETTEFLRVAEQNRGFAQSIFRHHSPAPREWAIIAAFYSSVHYINAYLWETYGFEPGDHSGCTLAVHSDAALVSIAMPYDTLRGWWFAARYKPAFQAPDPLIQLAFRYLDAIRNQIRNELGV